MIELAIGIVVGSLFGGLLGYHCTRNTMLIREVVALQQKTEDDK